MTTGRSDIHQIAKDQVMGVPMVKTAANLGLDRRTVANLRAKPNVKKIVERLREKLINETLESAVGNLARVVGDYQKPVNDGSDPYNTEPVEDIRLSIQKREHGMSASLRIAEGAGLLPGKNTNVFVTNNDNSVTIMPLIKQLIASKLGDLSAPEDEAIDVEGL